MSNRTIAYVGALGALGFLLMMVELPWLFGGFLRIDLSEMVVILGAWLGGLGVGIGVAIIKVFLLFLMRGTTTGGVGELAACAGSLIFLLSFWPLRHKPFLAAITSTLALVVGMTFLNFVWITPFFARLFDITFILNLMQEPLRFLWWCIVLYAPFNLVKGILVYVVFFALRRALPMLPREPRI